MLNWLTGQVKKADIELLMNTEATLDLIQKLNPDALILATGSKYVSIPVKGIENTITPGMAGYPRTVK